MSTLEKMEPSPVDLKTARQELLEARDRDEAIDVVLRFASSHFSYAATFANVSGEVQGLDAVGPSSRQAHRRAVRRVAVKPPWGSMLWSVMDTGGHFLGPGPRLEFDRILLADLGREAPRGVMLVPVRVGGRPVMMVYADNGELDLPPEGVVDLVTLCAALPAIFESFIRARKDSRQHVVQAEKAAWRARIAEAVEEASLEPTALDQLLTGSSTRADAEGVEPGTEEVAAAPKSAASPMEVSLGAASMDALSPEEPEVIVERLALGGEPEPTLLVALAGHGARGAKALAARFPGPTRLRANSFADMERDPLAHGPVVAAMAFLGPAASAELLDLCDSADAEARLYAAFLFVLCPDSRALPRLVEMLSDPDPRVATAARAAIASHRGLPGYIEALVEIRGELGRRNDPLRLCDVLRALAHLADTAAVPLIIDLLDHGDREVVAEAESALTWITKDSFGSNQRKWKKWYDKNWAYPRLSWLVLGLSHRSFEIRESAFLDLSEMVGETFGFDPDGTRPEREEAAEQWSTWLRERSGS